MSKLFIIQSTNLCNLNCKYCYLPGRKDPSLMGDQTLEQTIKLIFNSSLLVGNPVLCWHAGEPLTAKISFYKKALQYIQKHNKNNIKYTNNIQTNGVLIDDEWCEFFKAHNFSIGLSVDGPDFIHNKFRLNWANKGTHHLVQKGINKLKEHKIPINGICVLTKESLVARIMPVKTASP